MAEIKDTGERLIPEKHLQSLTYGEHLVRYKAAKELVKNKIVLDIASGAGYGTSFLSNYAKHIYGIDYSSQAIKYSKTLYGKNKNLEFLQGNAENIPIEDSFLDVVVSLETIEHIPNPEKFVKEVVRVLKPGGVFYVSTPNDDEFTEGNEYHLHEFTFTELNRLIRKYFKNYEYYYQGSWFASGVLNKHNFTEPTKEINAVKSFKQPLGRAIYYLAVASNSMNLPKLEENIVASDRYSELEAQKNSLDIKTKLEKLNKDKEKLEHELLSIYKSKGWKYLEKARKVKMRITRK